MGCDYSLISGHPKRHPWQVRECAPPCRTRLCRTEPHHHWKLEKIGNFNLIPCNTWYVLCLNTSPWTFAWCLLSPWQNCCQRSSWLEWRSQHQRDDASTTWQAVAYNQLFNSVRVKLIFIATHLLVSTRHCRVFTKTWKKLLPWQLTGNQFSYCKGSPGSSALQQPRAAKTQAFGHVSWQE